MWKWESCETFRQTGVKKQSCGKCPGLIRICFDNMWHAWAVDPVLRIVEIQIKLRTVQGCVWGGPPPSRGAHCCQVSIPNHPQPPQLYFFIKITLFQCKVWDCKLKQPISIMRSLKSGTTISIDFMLSVWFAVLPPIGKLIPKTMTAEGWILNVLIWHHYQYCY